MELLKIDLLLKYRSYRIPLPLRYLITNSSRRKTITFLFLLFLWLTSFAQKDTSIYDFDLTQIEDVLLENADLNDPDLIFIYETLQSYARNRLDLNSATYEDLKELPLLNELQVQQFILYKSKYGKLISLYELQSIPNFDLKTIRAILPFVKIKGGERTNLSLQEMFRQSKQAVVFRGGKILQERKGFKIKEGETTAPYEGSPHQLIFRYIGNFENKFKFGLVAEKDAGESFFSKSNKQGFDHYSGHLFLKDYSKFIKAVALGDYQVSFGQGLIAYSGFSGNKGANVMGIERSRRTLRYSASLNETQFLRGGGITLGLSDNIELTAFASSKMTDGNVLEADSIFSEIDLSEFENITTSIINAGNHRTISEIEDEKNIQYKNFGGNLKFKKDNYHIAFNSIVHQLDKPVIRSDQPYNRFRFEGDKLLNLSSDYGFFIRNINFFGETGWSDNGSIATVNGLLLALDEKVSLSLLHRYLPPDFQSNGARVFGETSQGSNENGLYLGLEVNPNKHWNFKAYFDSWQHPWLRSQVDAPSKGVEYFTRITYKRKRRLEVYLQIKNEIKERNAPDASAKIDYLVPQSKTNFRIHIANKISRSIELRTRAEWSFFKNNVEPDQKGYLLYQDIIFKSIAHPLSLSTRFALFDTDGLGADGRNDNGWDARIYAYENDLLYTFYIPAYYRKGTRFYINLRYRPTANWTFEFRYERTRITNDNVFSQGGNQEILGNVMSGIDAQVRFSF